MNSIFFKNMLLVIMVFCIVFFSCSTAPKRPTEIISTRNQAVAYQEQGNKDLLNNQVTRAQSKYTTAFNLATSINDLTLLCSINFSKISAYLTVGNITEAEKVLIQTQQFAQESKDKSLVVLCALYESRIFIALNNPEMAAESIIKAEYVIKNLKSNDFNTALAWRTIGEAYIILVEWEKAEQALQEAVKIHTKNKYINEIGHDWYLIAQARSLSENYEGALEALDNAIDYDKKSESSIGLAMDYLAKGIVFYKQYKKTDAQLAWQRSADIFIAMGITDNPASKRLEDILSE